MNKYDLQEYIHHLSYLGIFLWFFILEQLTPIPEEVSLISVGYIAHHTGLNLFICALAALAGLQLVDNLLFLMVFKGSKYPKKMIGKISPGIMSRIEKNIQNNAARTLFLIALIPKLRFFTPIFAGISGVKWKFFFFVNFMATVFYVSVYFSIGIFFHSQLQFLLNEIKIFGHVIFILSMIALSVVITVKAGKVIFKKNVGYKKDIDFK